MEKNIIQKASLLCTLLLSCMLLVNNIDSLTYIGKISMTFLLLVHSFLAYADVVMTYIERKKKSVERVTAGIYDKESGLCLYYPEYQLLQDDKEDELKLVSPYALIEIPKEKIYEKYMHLEGIPKKLEKTKIKRLPKSSPSIRET